MDIDLPDFDGCEVARRIRSETSNPNNHTPIVALTANPAIKIKQICRIVGMQSVFAKPLQSHQVREILSTYINGEKGPERGYLIKN